MNTKTFKNPARLFFLVSIILLNATSVSAKQLKNQLYKHASPYLAMHGTDPVQWQDWSEAVVKRAKKENKLIYISSGYFSCHWCHVMQRESYKNKDVAKILNKYFIPVKVDRELNPALDARLIDFVEKTQGQAGWPLNVFITPEGYPLVGMTYLPKDNFIKVLNNLKQQWKEKNDYLKSVAQQATTQLLAEQKTSAEKNLTTADKQNLVQQYLLQAADLMDEIQGGFGQQNKFPSVPQLISLLHIIKNQPLKSYIKIKWQDFLVTTLESIARQGLRDHVNGGFFRYTVDPNWQIPHFEKMLYDNAQLTVLYFEAGAFFKRQDFTDIAIETLTFMQTDLASPLGVIAASLSAVDNKGIEGGCYVWQQGDLKKYLSPSQFKLADKYWKLVNNEALESGYHLIQRNSLTESARLVGISEASATRTIAAAKQALRKVRSNLQCPIDTKPVAAWLGLGLQAFTLGAEQTANKTFKQHAKKLYQFIQNKLWKDKTLYRSIKLKKGKVIAVGAAGLEDYAFVAAGIYQYAKLTNNPAAKQLAVKLAKQAWYRFYKKDGWYLAEKPLIKYTIGKAALEDSPLPSPSAVLIKTSLLLKEKDLEKLAKKALLKGGDKIEEAPYWYASQIDVIREFL